ncbi:C40 family peptidase [Deinococcus maricopensis]|uniref:NLP/P60 protein n=1 Tax=Deinococcus maricopensis (strain DSM 21211 / LMG 22137 / NRRL B-23946 / LB-34) TaxID=709986 RepID=E8U8W6_DEIML|nr:C40 family peptidase [Deinococcus maricopensis]ADV67505.1 NLP/P60 protein [Deinococcus maricopensis DSM 21211]
MSGASGLDARVHAVDAARRVAEVALRDQLEGEWTYLTPRAAWAARGRVSLRAAPDERTAQVTEALLGEAMEVLEALPDGWAWVRTRHDGYLGFARAGAFTTTAPEPAVTVQVPRAHLFSAPRVSAPILDDVSFGARLPVLTEGPAQEGAYGWWRVAYHEGEAFLHAAATRVPAGGTVRSVAFLQRFLDTPYVWGGRSAWGLDCSGLTQLWAGPGVLPRDADQQQAALAPVEVPSAGDLAFFPGHVGIMLDERRMLHANATHMRVTVDTLGESEYGARLAADLLGFGRLP